MEFNADSGQIENVMVPGAQRMMPSNVNMNQLFAGVLAGGPAANKQNPMPFQKPKK